MKLADVSGIDRIINSKSPRTLISRLRRFQEISSKTRITDSEEDDESTTIARIQRHIAQLRVYITKKSGSSRSNESDERYDFNNHLKKQKYTPKLWTTYKKTTYNFQLVLIITYMLLTYPQVNLHVHGSLKLFSRKMFETSQIYSCLFSSKDWLHFSTRFLLYSPQLQIPYWLDAELIPGLLVIFEKLKNFMNISSSVKNDAYGKILSA